MLCLKKMLRNRLWENWPCMGFLLIISITIVGIIFGTGQSQQNSTTTRPKRSLERDKCLKKYGGIELNYTKGSTTSFTFDLCSVIKCGGRNSSWRGYDVYLCQLGYPGNQRWCPTWDHVLQATNRDFQGSTDKVTRDGKAKMAGYLKLQRDFSSTQNPITMSILELKQDLYKSKPTGVPNQCWGNEQGQWLDGVLGKWKTLILSILVSIAVFVSILVTCGCCCIPCIRSLCNRLIVAAIEKKDTSPPPYSMPLLSVDQNHESDDGRGK